MPDLKTTDHAPGTGSGTAVMERLEALARFSADGPNVMTRLYLTPEHRAAADQVAAWMTQAGMQVSMDAAGTVVGRLEGAQQGAPALLLGSHIDTVRNGGKYDGNLGVVLAIEAVRRATAGGRKLPYAIEVLAFGDEEGVRFPVTLTSSRAVAGIFDPSTLEAKDAEGISLRQALVDFGCDPAAIPAIGRARDAVLGYVEVHIEQGPVLEDRKLAVGIVTAISGATRLNVSVGGFAGHAGTVPMQLRRDAGAAAAEMVLAIERVARSRPDVVATVGRMELRPGAVNVIPGEAYFTLDIRSPNNSSRSQALEEIRRAFDEIARRRGTSVSTQQFYDMASATCDSQLVDGLEAAVTASGVAPLRLPSGAGHDGLAMAELCPFAMLFVRCKGGISHNPAESMTADDAATATNVLVSFLQSLDPESLTPRQEPRP